MVGEVLNMLTGMFAQLLELTDRIFTELDGWSVVIGAFTIFTIYRLLIVPIGGSAISSGASDVVRRAKEDAHVTNNPQAVTGLEGKKNG